MRKEILLTLQGIQHRKTRQWRVSEGSAGVEKDRGMSEEKRTDDRPAEGGTLNSGGPGAIAAGGDLPPAAPRRSTPGRRAGRAPGVRPAHSSRRR